MAFRILNRRPLDPDDVRMSFGDHIEELRRRVIFALLGLLLAAIGCFAFGDHIVATLAAPYTAAMERLGYDPRMVQLNPIESFAEYFKVALEFALVVAAPWILYQLWQFVAAGLYPSERRIVRAFAPASIGLFVVGASFMVVFVLSGLLTFLIEVTDWFPLPGPDNALYAWLSDDLPTAPATTTAPAESPLRVPVLAAEPTDPGEGDVWLNQHRHRLYAHYDGKTYYAPLQLASRRQFVQPFFSISQYLSFVVHLALAFGLGFQIPIVVVFLITLRLVPANRLAAARRYVVLVVFLAAAVITPTPDVATMLMLAVPMVLLFEAGLLIGRVLERRGVEAPAGE
jgi:sec-independent protein translocase protein TatC